MSTYLTSQISGGVIKSYNPLIFPDLSAGISFSVPYTVTKKGWIIGYAHVSGSSNCIVYLNSQAIGKEENDYIDIQIMVDIGDVISFSSTSTTNDLRFYPMKGT